MKTRKVDVAVIGAGTAGLSALKQIRNKTSNFVLIERGPLGTTCARVGCMPSKVFLQAAKDFHRREALSVQGIRGGENLSVHLPDVLKRVRELRDYFVGFVVESVENYGDRVIRGEARFIAPQTLRVGEETIEAGTVIIATGTRPIVPGPWKALGSRLVTTDEFFELEDLPRRIAVVGMGVIGTEMGQGLARLGVDVVAVGRDPFPAGIADPKVGEVAAEIFSREMKLYLGQAADVTPAESAVAVRVGDATHEVDMVLASLGRIPNLESLDLAAAGITVDQRGLPEWDTKTLKVKNHRVFVAGDVDGFRPILHEASDEGTIAGYNALLPEPECFQRRTPMGVTFSDPNAFFAGVRYPDLPEGAVVGDLDYSSQGRSRIKGENRGWLRVYGEPETGRILGAEGITPDGEHLAHLLAWSITRKDTVGEMLQYPFYHPVVEEGLRTALRGVWTKTFPDLGHATEVALCETGGPVGME